MKASNANWSERLAGKIPEDLAREIDNFETDIALRKQGKLDERVFAETRLRRGTYGQRYDNGKRHDGTQVRTFDYPSGDLTKGPSTMWDAPGMQRIKIPAGGLNATQLETLADLAEEYSDGIVHVTTRQDFQLHYVHIENTPSIMRRLAAVGITTREACGNSVRNVTACPYAGVCPDELFDVTPYARALSKFLMGHPDTQGFGRKFKHSFSGCTENACALASLHDMAWIAATREENGKTVRGFSVYVGGGLGAVPYQAKPFDPFVPFEEMLPLAQAVSRVFARLGEKKNRSRARIKFLVQDLGIEKFKELVLEERKTLSQDPRWTAFLPEAERWAESPLRPGGALPANAPNGASAFHLWSQTNLRPQKQQGYVTVTVTLPLGDLTAAQARALADIARRFTRETIRSTVEQNFVLRWVSRADLPEIYRALEAAGIAAPGAGRITDVVTCPGTDTCKLGISSSRGLAAELHNRLDLVSLDKSVQDLHIKISGCFNSCGQHHIADLGFYGVSRKVSGYAMPHFQLVLGGEWEHNARSYGLPVMAIPSKRIPEALNRLTKRYAADRQEGESFKEFIKRLGKAQLKTLLDDLTQLPADPADRSLFSDWGDPREYSLGDMGIGECAGEVITAIEFDLAAAEREVFDAQIAWEGGQVQQAGDGAYNAMLHAARALVKLELPGVDGNADEIVSEFRARYYDTQKFFDPFAGGKFANYLFAAHEKAGQPYTFDSSRYLIDEAHLFLEAAHSCYNRMGTPVGV